MQSEEDSCFTPSLLPFASRFFSELRGCTSKLNLHILTSKSISLEKAPGKQSFSAFLLFFTLKAISLA